MINSMWADIRNKCEPVCWWMDTAVSDHYRHIYAPNAQKKSKPDQRKPQVNAVANTVFH